MIVGDLKPIHEIVASLNGFKKVLVLGCGSCVTVCLSGGDREAQALARTLTDHDDFKGKSPGFETDTILRQCETGPRQQPTRPFLRIPTPFCRWPAGQAYRSSPIPLIRYRSFRL